MRSAVPIGDMPDSLHPNQTGYDKMAAAWLPAIQAVIGPKGLPPEVVQKVNAAVNETLADPVIRKRLLEEGSEILGMSPSETAAYIRAENARWIKVVKDAGIKPQ